MPTLDTSDRELLEHLHRSGGADVRELCELLAVTRTAVRSRLERLQAAGVITSDTHKATRGRPKRVYRITAAGLHALGEDYRELAVVFWDVIVGTENEAARADLLQRVRVRLADRFRRSLAECDSVEDRLDQLAEEMNSSGFNIESDHSLDLPILRETNCPFPMLADVDDTICQIEREVLEDVLGANVEFRHRCRDGHHCCEFEVTERLSSEKAAPAKTSPVRTTKT